MMVHLLSQLFAQHFANKCALAKVLMGFGLGVLEMTEEEVAVGCIIFKLRSGGGNEITLGLAVHTNSNQTKQ